LEKAIQQWPDALEPRVLLSHTLLQEGKDWPGAERALRAILRIQPQHAEASHNLKVLSQQKARGQVVHGE
jgi:hypothetical protein